MNTNLDNQLCFLLYVSSKEVIKQYTNLLKSYNLTYTGFISILAIEEQEHLTIKELGERLFLDSGTLTPLLKKLEKIGYIKRQRSTKDERQMMVYLTDEGRTLRRELPCISEKVFEKTKITEEQFFQLKEVLQSFVQNSLKKDAK